MRSGRALLLPCSNPTKTATNIFTLAYSFYLMEVADRTFSALHCNLSGYATRFDRHLDKKAVHRGITSRRYEDKFEFIRAAANANVCRLFFNLQQFQSDETNKELRGIPALET